MTAAPPSELTIVAFEPGPRRRHWARVARFSESPDRILSLDSWAGDTDTVARLIAEACDRFGVPEPALKFHARRSPYTGACERPRHSWVSLIGAEELAYREANGWGRVGENGAIRLGRTATLMTVAHEVAHHLVFHLDPPSTPAHGRIWVERFDQAATGIFRRIG